MVRLLLFLFCRIFAARGIPSSRCWQPILAIADIGPMDDRGLDDNCGPILAFYIGPKIAPDYRPRITARVKPH